MGCTAGWTVYLWNSSWVQTECFCDLWLKGMCVCYSTAQPLCFFCPYPCGPKMLRLPGMSPTHCSHLSKHEICTHHLLLPSLWLCCHTLPHRIFCSRCYDTAHNPGDLQSDSALRSFTNPHQCTSPTHYNWNSHTRLTVTVALPSLNQADVPRYCHVNQKPMSVASCPVFSADPQGDGLLGLFSFIPYKSLYNGCKKFLG